MRKVTVHEAKTHLSRLLREVEAGEEIIICRGKVEVARLARADASPRRGMQAERGAMFEHGGKAMTIDAMAKAFLAGELADVPKTPEMIAAVRRAMFGSLKHKIAEVDADEALKPVYTDAEWDEILDEDDLNLPPPE
jgi:prevent-host-death family protein